MTWACPRSLLYHPRARGRGTRLGRVGDEDYIIFGKLEEQPYA